jgi:hypothetical protein
MRLLLLTAMTCVLLCCGPKPNPPTPAGGDLCVAARDKLLALQCQDEGRMLGGPTRRGIPFEQFCNEKIEQGVMTTTQVQCLSTITDCKQVDTVCSWGN